MITSIDHRDPQIAAQIHALQQASYAVERDLIGVDEFHPLEIRQGSTRLYFPARPPYSADKNTNIGGSDFPCVH